MSAPPSTFRVGVVFDGVSGEVQRALNGYVFRLLRRQVRAAGRLWGAMRAAPGERRRSVRVEIPTAEGLTVEITGQGIPTESQFTAKLSDAVQWRPVELTDISVSGCSLVFVGGTIPQEGSTLEVTLRSQHLNVVVSGQVVHVRLATRTRNRWA